MEPDDQQLVGRLSFDELSTDAAEMEAGVAGDSNLEVVSTTPWYGVRRRICNLVGVILQLDFVIFM